MRLDHGWSFALCEPETIVSPAQTDALAFAPAQVPGSVAASLIAAHRWTWDAPPALDAKDVWYVSTIRGDGPHMLAFEGLATYAEVWLDDVPILRSDNMFVTHRVPVTLAGAHRLSIRFRALAHALAGRKGRARWRPRMIQPSELRFARTSALGHMPGFAPPAPPVGPWRPVHLLALAEPALLAARVSSRLDGADGLVRVELDFDRAPRHAPVIACGDAEARLWPTTGRRFAGTLRLRAVERWFPHTHGAPALHDVRLGIGEAWTILARTGFRSIEADRGADGAGFALRINGVGVFCRGAVWTPLDPIGLQNDPALLSRTIALAREAGVNMLRVGATSVYETDEFHRACDAAGILVWQDFMLSNFDYPGGEPDFAASLRDEARGFLERTSFSPSLAVLCGGNEVYQQAAMMGVAEANWRSSLFEETLPEICAAARPDAIYVANSPSGGALPFHSDSGVAHYYGVGAYRRPLEDARRANVRFASECLGFANVPEARALREDFGPAPLDSPLWRARIPRDQGAAQDFEDVRDHYLGVLYDVDPLALKRESPDLYLDLSRAAVADIVEATIGEWRRPGSSCAGALLWFWKDLWASSGWGVLDWRGLPKSPYWAMRRAFRSVQVVLADEGVNGLHVHCLNERPDPFVGRLALRCYKDGAAPIMSADRDVVVAPRAALSLRDCDLWGAFFDTTYAYRFGPPAHEATVAALFDGQGVKVAETWHFPLGRPAALLQPALRAEVVEDAGGYGLRLAGDRLALSVKIEDEHGVPRDNWFHLAPDEERIVRFFDPAVPPRGRVAALATPPVSYGASM